MSCCGRRRGSGGVRMGMWRDVEGGTFGVRLCVRSIAAVSAFRVSASVRGVEELGILEEAQGEYGPCELVSSSGSGSGSGSGNDNGTW